MNPTNNQTDKEGPIHDVSWNPNSKEFGVVYGYMPAKTTIFNFRGVAKHTFPLAPRNTIQFSPHGRFVLVAGFGNLAGQMDLYDMDKNYHKIITVEASNASVCAWSPDGQYILTATTSPRLRVDNGVRIWHVTGGLMYNEDMTELYDVTWRPQSIEQHPLGEPLTKLPVPHASATAYMGTRKAPVKPAGAYRPPGARGQLTPLAFKREDEGGAAFVRDGVPGASMNTFGKPRRREIPGAEPSEEYLPPGAAPGGGVALPSENLSKSAAKNKKKREAAKKAKEEGDGAPPANAPTGRSPDRNRNRGKNTSVVNGNGVAKAPPAAAPVPAPAPEPVPVEDPSAQDKKIRGLLKKIRAIDELKMRLAGGEKLEDTQMKKIQTEDAVRKELQAVGYDG
jgi:translation initiation factor 2A